MSIFRWYFYCLSHYFTLSGRASRSEYWSFILINALVGLVIFSLFGHAQSEKIVEGSNYYLFYEAVGAPFTWYALLIAIPTVTVTVRRLHDRDHSGWWIFWSWLFFPLHLIVLLFTLLPSQERANRFGPRAPRNSMDFIDNTPVYRENLKETADHDK